MLLGPSGHVYKHLSGSWDCLPSLFDHVYNKNYNYEEKYKESNTCLLQPSIDRFLCLL